VPLNSRIVGAKLDGCAGDALGRAEEEHGAVGPDFGGPAHAVVAVDEAVALFVSLEYLDRGLPNGQ
jgi:hypothetical protein